MGSSFRSSFLSLLFLSVSAPICPFLSLYFSSPCVMIENWNPYGRFRLSNPHFFHLTERHSNLCTPCILHMVSIYHLSLKKSRENPEDALFWEIKIISIYLKQTFLWQAKRCKWPVVVRCVFLCCKICTGSVVQVGVLSPFQGPVGGDRYIWAQLVALSRQVGAPVAWWSWLQAAQL